MTLTWDLFVALSFVIMAIYGFLLGRSRVFSILIHTYVGYVVAFELGDIAYQYLSKVTQLSHSISVTMFGAKVFVFAFIVFILTLNSELMGVRDDTSASKIWTVLYGVLAAGLILSSVFAFMGNAEMTNLFATSTLAAKVYEFRIVWLIGPIVTVLSANIVGRFRKR
jgi:hypothetical protein